MQQAGLACLALWLLAYGLRLARRLIRTYRRAVRLCDDTHSEHIAAYIRWMSVFTWWAVIYGVSCGLLTFLPDRYVFLWVLSSIPFYIYLYWSYMNYLLFYEQVESVLEQEQPGTADAAPRESASSASAPASPMVVMFRAGARTGAPPPAISGTVRREARYSPTMRFLTSSFCDAAA